MLQRLFKTTLFHLALWIFIGCGNSQKIPRESLPPSSELLSSRANANDALSEPENNELQYLVVYKTTRLFIEPDEDAAYVQFISPAQLLKYDKKIITQDRERRLKEKQQAAIAKDKRNKKREKLARRKKKQKKRLLKKNKRKKKKHKKKSKKQKAKERRRVLLKKEKAKAKLIAAKHREATKEIRKVSKRIRNRFPEGDIISFLPFRKIGEKSGWVHVETISASSDIQHCHQDAFEGLADIKLRFWIRRSDIAPVVSRSVKIDGASGQRVNILPGVGILKKEGASIIFSKGFQLKVDIHDDSKANFYLPLRNYEIPITDRVFSAAGRVRGLKFGRQKLPINPFISNYVSQTLQIGTKQYASFQSPCAEIFVRVRKGDIERAGPRKATRFMSGFGEATRVIRQGSELSTPTGKKLGVVLQDFPVSNNDEEGCFTMRLWKGNYGKRSLRLCANYD